MASFPFDDNILKLTILNEYLFVFSNFPKLKISIKLEEIWIFIWKLDLENSRPNWKLFFLRYYFLAGRSENKSLTVAPHRLLLSKGWFKYSVSKLVFFQNK